MAHLVIILDRATLVLASLAVTAVCLFAIRIRNLIAR